MHGQALEGRAKVRQPVSTDSWRGRSLTTRCVVRTWIGYLRVPAGRILVAWIAILVLLDPLGAEWVRKFGPSIGGDSLRENARSNVDSRRKSALDLALH